MDIKILNPVYCQAIGQECKDHVKTILSVEGEIWIQKKFGKQRKMVMKNYMDRNGNFLYGLRDRIDHYSEANGITINWIGEVEVLPHTWPPKVKGIEFRPDQMDLIKKAVTEQRGYLKAIARSGKTVVASGIISCFPGSRVLFLLPTIDILEQTEDEFKKFGFTDIGVMGKGRKEWGAQITLSTYHSFKNMDPEEYIDVLDVVLIDECHHANKEDGVYGKILTHCLAPVRIGLTATPPDKNPHAEIVMEGLLGGKLGEVTPEMGKKLGIVAEPKIRFLKVPEQNWIKDIRTYREAYVEGVVNNRAFNRLVCKTAKEYIEDGNTVLILVGRVLHGFLIEDTLKNMFDIDAPFICGGLDSETTKEMDRLKKFISSGGNKSKAALREAQNDYDFLKEIKKKVEKRSNERNIYRKKLDAGEYKCVIATNIWNEGVNIPSLNVVINAVGGKSEKRVIQMSSRSLTKCPGKEYGIIVDFFNPNSRYFVDHFGDRLTTYFEMGWMDV